MHFRPQVSDKRRVVPGLRVLVGRADLLRARTRKNSEDDVRIGIRTARGGSFLLVFQTLLFLELAAQARLCLLKGDEAKALLFMLLLKAQRVLTINYLRLPVRR